MAPGVARSPLRLSLFLPLSLTLSLSIAAVLPLAPSSSSPRRLLAYPMAAQPPRAFCSRIPAPRRPILLLFRSRFAPAPPARRRDSRSRPRSGLLPRDRDERKNGRNHRLDLIAIATMRWFIAGT